MSYVLTPEDRQVVEHTLRNVAPDIVPQLQNIHTRQRADARRRRAQLLAEMAPLDRTIAMRTYALELLDAMTPKRRLADPRDLPR